MVFEFKPLSANVDGTVGRRQQWIESGVHGGGDGAVEKKSAVSRFQEGGRSG